jgi:ankyrin repeat protein
MLDGTISPEGWHFTARNNTCRVSDIRKCELEGGIDSSNIIEPHRKKRIVSLLIEKGADINITDLQHSRTPLHLVCFEGTLEIVRNLLDNGANINAKDSYGMTPLEKRCKRSAWLICMV